MNYFEPSGWQSVKDNFTEGSSAVSAWKSLEVRRKPNILRLVKRASQNAFTAELSQLD